MMSVNDLLFHPRRQQVSLPAMLGLVVSLVFVGLLILAFGSKPSSTAGVPEFTAPLLDGTTMRLSDYRGQVVMLNFWATWCPPCRAEMPMLQTASESYQDQGVVILAVNNAEPASQIQTFADTLGLHLTIVLDEEARLQRMFGIVGYPTSIFIDREGNVYATHLGAVNSEQITEYIDAGMSRPS
jgi:thiol-disulfide isomerase/thioredoxin